MLLEIEVSNQARAVKFPLAWQKQTREHGSYPRVPLIYGEEGGWDLWSGTQQIFIGINIQIIPVWLFFLVKYLLLTFFEGRAEVDNNFSFWKDQAILMDCLNACGQFLWSWVLCLDF